MSTKIAIVFGAGKRIGSHSVQTFKSKGFKVAQVSRSVIAGEENGVLSIPCDLSQPSLVKGVFEQVRKTWGEPSVIVYNGKSTPTTTSDSRLQFLTMTESIAFGMHLTQPEDTFSISLETFQEDLAINTTSAYAAAIEALISFRSFSADVPRSFIYTGNILNEGPVEGFLTLGVGKIASAHMIDLGDGLFRKENIRFFFVDERMEDGTPMFIGAGPQEHADLFVSLADRTAGDVPWQITFLAGKGYVEFPHKVLLPGPVEMKKLYATIT